MATVDSNPTLPLTRTETLQEASSSRLSLETGSRFGRYRIVRQLGAGGMGAVYEVRHPSVPRPLALKLIHGQLAGEIALARFEREALTMARVQHANVVRVHTVDRAAHGPYIVTELVEGESLAQHLRGAAFAPREAARIVLELAGAIDALHRNEAAWKQRV